LKQGRLVRDANADLAGPGIEWRKNFPTGSTALDALASGSFSNHLRVNKELPTSRIGTEITTQKPFPTEPTSSPTSEPDHHDTPSPRAEARPSAFRIDPPRWEGERIACHRQEPAVSLAGLVGFAPETQHVPLMSGPRAMGCGGEVFHTFFHRCHESFTPFGNQAIDQAD
jgi:hypothetical protein